MTSERGHLLKINCPELFADPAFAAWLNAGSAAGGADNRVATWHVPDEPPGEYSDLFMMIYVTDDAGEGSDADMPEACWDAIVSYCRAVGFRHGVVWLTNLQEYPVD
jgi:hypothetical protein